MRTKRIALGVLAILVIFSGTASPVAAQSVSEEDCPVGEDNLILVLPGGTVVEPGENITLYPGTKVNIALCDGGIPMTPGPNKYWALRSAEGLSVAEPKGKFYPATIANVNATVEVALGEATTKDSVTAPKLTVVAGNVVTASPGEETYQISVENPSQFRKRNEAYYKTAREMRTSANRLNRSADTGNISKLSKKRRGVNQTGVLESNYRAVQSMLFRAATRHNRDAVAALGAYYEHRNETLTAVRTDLRNANDQLRTRARKSAMGVVTNLLGFVLLGAIVGGVGGWYVTDRVLDRVAHRRSRTSAVDFHPKQLGGQLLVALVCIVAAGAVVWQFELVGPLGAVFEAVIGL
ncbi:MAG: hypothetical protein ABEK02_01910 [Haloquadratum sp.]